jgi:hypothetical protein
MVFEVERARFDDAGVDTSTRQILRSYASSEEQRTMPHGPCSLVNDWGASRGNVLARMLPPAECSGSRNYAQPSSAGSTDRQGPEVQRRLHVSQGVVYNHVR